MLGETITQTSNLNTSAKWYSFPRTLVHVRGGIYRGPSLHNLCTNDYFAPLLFNTTPLNYRGEVVFLLFETSFFMSSCQSSKLLSSRMSSHPPTWEFLYWILLTLRVQRSPKSIFALESLRHFCLFRAKSKFILCSWILQANFDIKFWWSTPKFQGCVFWRSQIPNIMWGSSRIFIQTRLIQNHVSVSSSRSIS